MNSKINKFLFITSLIISVLLLFVSASGLMIPGLYDAEKPVWKVQCYGQDAIDLVLILPCLIISSVLLRTGNYLGRLSWPGIMLYLVYTFTIYCFNVRFNLFFVEYCVILGLCVYSLAYYAFTVQTQFVSATVFSSFVPKVTAGYFCFIGIVFYLVWLRDIVPAIRHHSTPPSIVEAGLATNPVHVIDLSVVLPLFVITGILLFRKKQAGLAIAAPLLFFTVLMDLTISALNLFEGKSIVLSVAFAALGLFSLTLFIGLAKQLKLVAAPSEDASR